MTTFGSLGMLRPAVTAHVAEREPMPQLSIAWQLAIGLVILE